MGELKITRTHAPKTADEPSHEVFAVIWCDFIPLSLHCKDGEEAMSKARVMRERVAKLGRFMDIRAVWLPEGKDTLIDLLPREVSAHELQITNS